MPHRETQHGVQREPHLQHYQHRRRGRPADLLRHLLQRLLQPGAGPLQQQPGAVRQRSRGSGPGRGSLDHPVRPVWLWVRQTPVQQEEQRWAFQSQAKLNELSWCVSILGILPGSAQKLFPAQRVLFLLFLDTVVRLLVSPELPDRFALQFCLLSYLWKWCQVAKCSFCLRNSRQLQGAPGNEQTRLLQLTKHEAKRSVSSRVTRPTSAAMCHGHFFYFFFLDKLVKQRSTGSSPKSAPLTWVDVLSLPLSANRDPPQADESQHRSVLVFIILVSAANSVRPSWKWSWESGVGFKLAAAAPGLRSEGASPLTRSDRRGRGRNRGLPRLRRVFTNDISSHLTGRIST